MEKPRVPESVAIRDTRDMLIYGINYAIQETGISFCNLESIMKDLYAEVAEGAQKELQEAEEKYKQEVAAYEEAQKKAQEEAQKKAQEEAVAVTE